MFKPYIKTFLVAAVALLAFALGGFFVWSNYKTQINPTVPQASGECGIENCHGLDIVCGKPAEACTMMYQLGDKCRQYAQCGIVNGKCQQIENPKFSACKACAQKCEKEFPNDPDKAFACESKCGE